ncbi:MAG: hypothetical protein ABI700_22605 [Chloroflexota bacterium]
MIPLRIQVKFFISNSDGVDLAAFAPIFQRWIQQKSLEGQLVDVADYRHVFEGPSIVLIAHDSDYTMENRAGRLGLLYTRKRHTDPDLQTQLRTSIRLALTAARLLESERAFTPRLKFRGEEFELRFLDRLQLPNKPESATLIRGDLSAVLSELYGEDGAYALPVKQDARYPLAFKVKADEEVSVTDLLLRQPVAK